VEFEPRGVQRRAAIIREGTPHGRTVAPHDCGFRITPACETPFEGAPPTDTLLAFFLRMSSASEMGFAASWRSWQ